MAGHYEDNIFFIGDFDDQLENDIIIPLVKEISAQKKKNDKRIDLWINSVGGYAHLCFNLIELVEIAKRNDVVVRTIVPSIAFSAGSMLAITGTPGERYISKSAEHLVHYGSTGSMETTPTQVERFRAWKDRDFKRTLNLYKKYCNIPDIESHMLDDGYFIPADKALKWGMADKYLEKLPV